MHLKWSEMVREVADSEYVKPSSANRGRILIRLGEHNGKLMAKGFPAGHMNQVATSLESKKFWQPRGLVMVSPRGLPRQNDTVLEFRFASAAPMTVPDPENDPLLKLRGRLRGVLREGAEAFLQAMRRDDEDAA